VTTYSDRFSARNYDLVLTVTQGPQSVLGNYTDLACSLKIVDAGGFGSWDTDPTSTYSATIDGSTVSGSFGYDFRNYNSRTLRTWTKRVYHNAAGDKTASVSASSSAGVIGSAATSGSFSPDHIVKTPAAPSTVTATRVSDTRQALGWTINAGAPDPATSQRVQRSEFNTGAWRAYATIATGLSAAATSYNDDTAEGDRAYRYRIQAVNAAGTATSGATGVVYTTPATPTSAVATKTAGNDIEILITPAQRVGAVEFVLEHSTNNGTTWAALTTVAGSTSPTTHMDTAPNPIDTHRYRVATRINNAAAEAGDNLQSGTVMTANIQLAAPPNAPTGLAPSTPADATEARTLTWIHNPTDTSPQSKFQIRHRETGNPTWTTETAITSSASSWVLAAGTYPNGSGVEWEVKTWGQHPDAGIYSATGTYATTARPTVANDAPLDGATLATAELAAAWTYYQAQGEAQAAWKLTLLQGGTPIETQPGAGTTATWTMETELGDGETFTLRTEVQSASGLWSEPTDSTFSVAYLLPADATIGAEYVPETGAALITITPAAATPGVTEDATTARLQRSLDGGTTWANVTTPVALTPETATLVNDPIPTIAGITRYRAHLYTDLGATTDASTQPDLETAEPGRTFYNYGPGYGTVAVMHARPQPGGSANRAKAYHKFAGRKKRVLFGGTATELAITAAGRLFADGTTSTLTDWEQAAQESNVGCYRDPKGRHIFGGLEGFAHAWVGPEIVDVSYTIEETDE